MQLKTYWLFFPWNFPFNNFRLQLTTGNENCKVKVRQQREYCIYSNFGATLSIGWWVNIPSPELCKTLWLWRLVEHRKSKTVQRGKVGQRRQSKHVSHYKERAYVCICQVAASDECLPDRKNNCPSREWMGLTIRPPWPLGGWQCLAAARTTGDSLIEHIHLL